MGRCTDAGKRQLQHNQDSCEPDVKRGTSLEQLPCQESGDEEQRHAVDHEVLPERRLVVYATRAKEEGLVVVYVGAKGDASDDVQPDCRYPQAHPCRYLERIRPRRSTRITAPPKSKAYVG